MGLSGGNTCALSITRKTKNSECVKQWLQKRDTLSNMSLVAELLISSDVDLKNYLRMSGVCLKVLLHLLKSHIE
jgi:hypothetical protein